MEDETQKAAPGGKKTWSVVMSWVGGATALIGLFASLGGALTWFVNHHKRDAELDARMALAQTQAKQEEYQASVQSYGDILKADPTYRPALDERLNATMLWVENFSVQARQEQSAADLSAPALDQILAILNSGLVRTKGSQAADVQAHIGWTHWLNQHIANREFGSAAERDLRAALASDPSNVYANAMLGNWMLQTKGDFAEAIQHLNIAVSTGKARPLVRSMQLGLIYDGSKGARAELIKVANDMRKAGEPLDDGDKSRILGFCFDPAVTDHAELVESLSAVPQDEAWKTYLWLDDMQERGQSDKTQLIVRDFVQANLLEISGKEQESLDAYRLLQKELKNQSGRMKNAVDAAVTRLSTRSTAHG